MRVVRVPRPEMQHSRLHRSASQERHSLASSSDQTCSGPWSTRSATSRPSITSPSRPIVGRASGLPRPRLPLAGSGLTWCEPVGPVQPDEVGRCDAPPALQAGGRAPEQEDLVVPTRAYWLHESPAWGELLHQRRRNARERGGDQDRVERGSGRQPTASVRDEDFEARDSLRVEVVPRRRGQFGEALHADHLAREPGQQGGLEAVARADLEHTLPSLERQRLEHPRHQGRLGGDLAMRDLDRLVAISAIHTLGGHKRRAGYRADRLEHARVAHTGGMNQTRQLPGPRGRLRRAGNALHGAKGYAGSAAEPRAYGNPVPELVLGPVLRYVGIDAATVWVEADAPCQVEVLGHPERTFTVDGHHYALVCIGDLAPGQVIPYDVRLDGRRVWPPPDHPFPQPAIRTLDGRGAFQVAFGSCRVALPHWPPYTLAKDEHPDGREFDALFTLARELLGRPREDWPDLLLMLGDQVYVDEGSPAARRRIRATRDTSAAPGQEVARFEEYTWLYHESWGDPVIRWLLSTIPTAMVLDDHDMADDWNISGSWKEEMNRR